MEKARCAICYQELDPKKDELYHHRCSLKLFGLKTPPSLDYDLQDVEKLAKQEINQRITITGVQPKLSLDFSEKTKTKRRLTFVGLWGRFILKPPHPQYPFMPELEDVTMHMAEIMGIRTAIHGLIQFRSGEWAYIARRFDRPNLSQKLAQEDFCQLSEKLTEEKYHGSMEKAGKLIHRWSSNPGFDSIRFLELAVFSFLTGNGDMHLKNFSLLTTETGNIQLAPAYDLLSTRLLIPKDKEESALSINGKKAKLCRKDFVSLGKALQIPDRSLENMFVRLKKKLPLSLSMLEQSYLTETLKKQYKKLIRERAGRVL